MRIKSISLWLIVLLWGLIGFIGLGYHLLNVKAGMVPGLVKGILLPGIFLASMYPGVHSGMFVEWVIGYNGVIYFGVPLAAFLVFRIHAGRR